MKVEQLYTGCLAEAAYYIESEGEAAIIDPLREVDQYIEMAEKRGAKIKYVFETHFHADFVSGHIDLAMKTGATIVYGQTAQPNFAAYIIEDGEELTLGKLRIRALHTPGHTMESTSYLLFDPEGKPHSVYTGDTLFIGDVGRPDLAIKSDLTQADLAAHLFESLRTKIMTLPDDVIVYPGHGQGSACGKNMSKDTFDTIGHQKETNYALRADMTKEEFIKEVTTGLIAPPQYFPKNAIMNKMGYRSFDHVLEKGLTALSVADFEKEMQHDGVVILDTRNEHVFTEGFVPGSLFIGIDGTFAPWVGLLIEDIHAPILIVADEGREEEVITRLSRVGYDNSIGYLKGGFQAWKAGGKPIDFIPNISPIDFSNEFPSHNDITVLDVRKESEYESQHFGGIINFPLDLIYNNLYQLNGETNYMIHCAGGYRSVAAASILKRAGFKKITNITGGFQAIAAVGKLKVTKFHEPISML